ncbi:MAG: zinc-ribbon domain-containing protein [Hydrogenophaga sp.]|nr:zinc-ribbon domain-containing protein [Hydrogenophaga sp.]
MALVKCKDCGTDVSNDATACPKCGARTSKFKWWLWIPLGSAAAFLGYGFILSNTPEGEQRSRDRTAIRLCWSAQGSKSLDPGAQRFAAGACERMEREFRQKHGVSP